MSSQHIPKSRLLQLRRKELALLKQREELRHLLPHIYQPLYPWQRRVIESDNRVNLLTAANQVGKSTALIRRVITNATDSSRWERLWGKAVTPRQFWYFYPDAATVLREIDTKWIPEWLPRGAMITDPVYGWKLVRKSGTYDHLAFNSGVTIYFQSYMKRVANVQAGSIYEVFTDEELPMEFYNELIFRLTATNGILTSGFTPTLNQLYWKQAMETNKVLPSALKLTVSMYDCLQFEDGTPSKLMTIERIRQAEERCSSETERQRRIHGKFVTEAGRTYYAFDFDKHMVKRYPIPGYIIYAAVDYGSGTDTESFHAGKKNHPAAICFVAVNPDYRSGVVMRAWRGDGLKTTAGDVFTKYQELSSDLRVTHACYDASSKDFGTIAQRNGVSFVPADKSRMAGEDLVNTLFKHKMLEVFDDSLELLKLGGELQSVMVQNQKSDNKTGDDLADTLRYACNMIPWDLSAIDESKAKETDEEKQESVPKAMSEKELLEMQIKMRRGENVRGIEKENNDWNELEDEFSYWNDQFG